MFTLPAVDTSCGDTTSIRFGYFCYDDRIITINNGQVTTRTGCADFSDFSVGGQDVFDCPESFHRVNILVSEFYYLNTNSNCSNRERQCDLVSSNDSVWLFSQENCFNIQNCPLSALAYSNQTLYGCNSFTVPMIADVTYIYSYICQFPEMFDFPELYPLAVEYTCIGMSDDLHAVVYYGRFENNLCWQVYTNCSDEDIGVKRFAGFSNSYNLIISLSLYYWRFLFFSKTQSFSDFSKTARTIFTVYRNRVFNRNRNHRIIDIYLRIAMGGSPVLSLCP